MRTQVFIFAMAVCVGSVAGPARADLFEALSDGLWYMGFRTEIVPNPITNGFDGTSTKYFTNDTMNFGRGTLTLSGSLNLSGSIDRRPVPELNFGMDTGGQNLQYTLDIPAGLEQVTVTGQVHIDTQFSVDQGGWYHKVVWVDNRGTVTTTGVLGDDVNNIDFSLGPIDVTGNVFFDGVGAMRNLLSGDAGGLSAVLGTQELAADLDPANLDLSDSEQLEAYVNAALLEGLTQAALDPTTGKTVMAVPEPSTLLLLALAGGAALYGVRQRHRA